MIGGGIHLPMRLGKTNDTYQKANDSCSHHFTGDLNPASQRLVIPGTPCQSPIVIDWPQNYEELTDDRQRIRDHARVCRNPDL
jgi:hypothetical protein